jgi:hypothetical protein
MASPVYDGWRIIDGMCTARSVHLSIAQYRESEVYVARTFDPEYNCRDWNGYAWYRGPM